MKYYEKEEIAELPDKYRPLGAWAYVGYEILFMLPIVGFICLIVFSLNSTNIPRRSFARSYFCLYLIILVIVILIIVIAVVAGSAIFAGIMK